MHFNAKETTIKKNLLKIVKFVDGDGIILENNKKDLVEKALLRSMENRKYRISATEKSYERLIKGFTWEKVADKIEHEFL